MSFSISDQPIQTDALRADLLSRSAGGFVSFEGWVRDHNDGEAVNALEYSAYQSLAEKEGSRIIDEAKERFEIDDASGVHRIGSLAIGDLAVWVGVSAAHRGAAFDASRYIIDEVKARVPIWKREYYVNKAPTWVNCAAATKVKDPESR